jgi:enamine deaminase RidA (YjgF/YER057c/UK114 family)
MTVQRRNAEGLADPPGYSHVASAAGRIVCTAGAVPLDAEGNVVGLDDPVAQAQRCLENLEVQLAAGGAAPDDVVKTTVYVTGASHEHQSAVWEVVQASPFAAAPSTLLGVALLGYRGQLVEIEAIAVVDDQP